MIANQLLLLLVLPVLWPSTAMPLTPGNIGKVFGLPDSDGGRVLQRSKRGWMWNQFFLLEEYTGNDHQYVGKVTCPWYLMHRLILAVHWCDELPGNWLDGIQRKCMWSALFVYRPTLFLWLFHHAVCSAKIKLLYHSQSYNDFLLGRCHCLVITMTSCKTMKPNSIGFGG